MVEYAGMRKDLIHYLYALSDEDYQQKVWLHHDFPQGIAYDGFDAAVDFFEDTGLTTVPEKSVGYLLHNSKELEAIHQLVDVLNPILESAWDKLYPQADAAYLQSDEWQTVIHAAQNALETLQKEHADSYL